MLDFFRYLFTHFGMVGKSIGQHVVICSIALFFGILIALPLAIYLTRKKHIAKYVMMVFSVINTIPSLVLLGVAMVIFGVGMVPAVAVLLVYSILPILRNTFAGICQVDPKYIRAAKGMGMNQFQSLVKIELPLALPAIIGGIRLSAVYVISWGTLAAFIGAGGLGDLIWGGLQSYNYNMMLCGAIPATILALLTSFLLNTLEKWIRLRAAGTRKRKQVGQA